MIVREVQQVADCLCSSLSVYDRRGTVYKLQHACMHVRMYMCGALSSTNLINRGAGMLPLSSLEVTI